MKDKIKRSIGTKVIVQVTTLIASILIISIGSIIYINISDLQERANFDLQTRVKQLTHNVEQRLEYLQESTELLGTNELLVNAFIDQGNREKYLMSLINNFRQGKYLNSLSVVDFVGRVIFHTDKSVPKFSELKELRIAMNFGQTITYFDHKKDELVFIVPIKYYATTQGAIIAAYNIKNIIDTYNTNEDFIYTSFFSNTKPFYSKSYDPQEQYYKFRLPADLNYKILYSIGTEVEMGILEDVYMMPMRNQIILLSFIGLIILFIGAFVSNYLARTITDPILTLYNRINKKTSKNLKPQYIPLGTEDELDILGYAYYKKEKELNELNESLYKKIKEATKELEEERNRFSLAIEGSKDGLWDWNIKTNEFLFSDRFETMLGYDVGDMPMDLDSWFGIMHPDDRDKMKEAIKEYLYSKTKESFEHSFRLLTKDGSWRWILSRGKALFDKDREPLRFVGFNTDISQQKEYQDKLDHTAKHDSLTHLPNRFLLSELRTHEMHNSKRKEKHLALLFIDLDGFKDINDVYGHETGDEVLSVVAARMHDIVRESDIVSRLGGDEFVIVLTNLNNNSEAIPTLQRLLHEISTDIILNDDNMSVSASIGVSFYPQVNDIGNEALLRQADQAMYNAKLLGKNQYQFFNLEASDELQEHQKYISNLRHAIKESQFTLHYQPKVEMQSNNVIGFEALIRWNHPQEGLLYPDSFLPFIAHEPSFMIELGNWVFENAFAQLEYWHMSGLDFSLSINVSPYEIQEQDFIAYLKKLFKKHPGVKPNKIEIELLETAAFDNFEFTSNTLLECQKLGVKIAIDDFGTGYASLHYLKKLPMNTIKIDKGFVIDLLYTSNSISIIEASIGLAHAFNVDVIAEGVESEEHGNILLQLGCKVAQGYVISRPMPADHVLEWVRSYKGFTSWSSIKHINDSNRTILYASVEHRNWINSIAEFVENRSSDLPQLNHKKCYLGNWILNEASQEIREYPEYKTLSQLHIDLHKYAEELLISNENDKLKGIGKLKDLHKEILEQLEALIERSSNS